MHSLNASVKYAHLTAATANEDHSDYRRAVQESTSANTTVDNGHRYQWSLSRLLDYLTEVPLPPTAAAGTAQIRQQFLHKLLRTAASEFVAAAPALREQHGQLGAYGCATHSSGRQRHPYHYHLYSVDVAVDASLKQWSVEGIGCLANRQAWAVAAMGSLERRVMQVVVDDSLDLILHSAAATTNGSASDRSPAASEIGDNSAWIQPCTTMNPRTLSACQRALLMGYKHRESAVGDGLEREQVQDYTRVQHIDIAEKAQENKRCKSICTQLQIEQRHRGGFELVVPAEAKLGNASFEGHRLAPVDVAASIMRTTQLLGADQIADYSSVASADRNAASVARGAERRKVEM